MTNSRLISFVLLGPVLSLTLACAVLSGRGPGLQDQPVEVPERESKIPAGAVKMSPENDEHPPSLDLGGEYEAPIPLPGFVNTAGLEDSPFITPDGNTLYFFFTPDANVPAEKQILDGVTGIYVSHKTAGKWDKPQRVVLQDPGKLSLDGCAFVQGDVMWFCTLREGYAGLQWFTARYEAGLWKDWAPANFKPAYEVGELHITSDGSELYFGSSRPGGKGALDIWVSKNVAGEWQEPLNVSALNTADSEGWPAVSPDGSELWFYRNFAIWRSISKGGEWQPAEQVISSLAGEPSVDADGNLYFVHHYYIDGKMIEADIYVAYRKAGK